MTEPHRASTRRDLLIASGTSALGLAIAPLSSLAQDVKATDVAPEPQQNPTWQDAIRAVTGDAKVGTGKIIMELPEIAENGNVVPFNITVDSPMTETSFVRSLRLYSTSNPQALIATFRFSPDSGKAAVSSRIRLAKSQEVVALAELSDGTFLSANRNVKVTIGGCGG